MLTIPLYDSPLDLWRSDVFDDQESLRQTIIIAPSPAMADAIRDGIRREHPTWSGDVITISRLIRDRLSDCAIEGRLVTKASLMLLLSSVYAQRTDAPRLDHFLRSFNFLTELRSYSLSADVLQTVLEEEDPSLRETVTLFSAIMEAMDMFDEHRAAHGLAEYYRGPIEAEPRRYVFWGFTNVSGIQVDLIKAMAIRQDVIIPFPRRVYDERASSDWISWFNVEAVSSPSQRESSHRPVEWLEFPSRRLAETLTAFQGTECDARIIVAASELPLDAATELLFPVSFKSPVDLFSAAEGRLREKWDSRTQGETASVAQFHSWIVNEGRAAASDQDWRTLKVLSLWNEIALEWEQLSDHNVSISSFDIDVWTRISSLRHPRTFAVPLFQTSEGQRSISLLDAATGLAPIGQKTVLVIGRDFPSLFSSERRYSETVERTLCAIAPMRRSEFEFLLIRETLHHMVRENPTTVFIEQGLQDEDVRWGRMWDGIPRSPRILNRSAKSTMADGLVALELPPLPAPTLSASRLQTYIDCPRQYYYRFIDPRFPRVQVDDMLSSAEMGELEHAIIGDYLRQHSTWSETSLADVIQGVMERDRRDHHQGLSPHDERRARIELEDYSRPAIQRLLRLRERHPDTRFTFECPLPPLARHRGRIDLLIENQEGTWLVDFKRGSSSVPSKRDVLNYDKIQLWVYLAHFGKALSDYVVWGYFNLSSPDDSLFWAIDEVAKDTFTSIVPILPPRRTLIPECSLEQSVTLYLEKENEWIDRLQQDQTFLPHPRSASVCQFCDLAAVCGKGRD